MNYWTRLENSDIKGNFQIIFKRTSIPLLSVVTDAPWQIIDQKKKKEVKIETPKIQSGFVAAKGSVSVKSGKKQKLEESESLKGIAKNLMAAQIVIASEDSSSPFGLIWDHNNCSCAYNALLTILYKVWSADTKA